MDDYWKEVENITRSGEGTGRSEGGGEGEVQEEEQQKTPEGKIHPDLLTCVCLITRTKYNIVHRRKVNISATSSKHSVQKTEDRNIKDV